MRFDLGIQNGDFSAFGFVQVVAPGLGLVGHWISGRIVVAKITAHEMNAVRADFRQKVHSFGAASETASATHTINTNIPSVIKSLQSPADNPPTSPTLAPHCNRRKVIYSVDGDEWRVIVGASLNWRKSEMTDTQFDASPDVLTATAQGRLRTIIERVERLEDDKAAVALDIKEVMAEAKGEGYDTKIIRQVVRIRRMDKAKRQEAEAILDLYLSALGEN